MFKRQPKVPAEKSIKLNVINAIELKPDSTYMLIADSRHISRADIDQIMKDLKRGGVNNVVSFMLSGGPDDAIQFVQSNSPKKRRR